ncbi:quinoprotein dehydrogenase-associated SoxYZ-like carrier [Oceaniglobus roseus]|uniref:quinoprotein dehydrogenase-associated SoxYZ-like carrier n=1 Tax=Oceaniglobus roseus TaxID=1737570 RepID=UPI000C7ED02D|nr:quinoprotein dehydrogenase-associated SoxYZ-like carrier [Kandeliimicrobium roseum]
MTRITLLAGAALVALAPQAMAGEAWDDVRQALFGDDYMTPAADLIAIDAPYRTDSDARTQIAATVSAPPGRQLESVMVILDENPMPVSAVFTMRRPLERFFFDVTMRINGPTPLHIVARTTEGQMLVAEAFVKTSGQGACSAPPGTDPKEALADLGQMTLDITDFAEPVSLASKLNPSAPHDKKLDLGIRHPSHSGLQMDQISLLFIPTRYVDSLDIDLDGQDFVDVTGSISLSENPHLTLGVPGDTHEVDVELTDTGGAVTHAHKAVTGF